MTYQQDIEEGYQALDLNTVSTWARSGYAVIEPAASATSGACAVTPGSGTLDAVDTLSVASGSVLVNGQEVSVASQSVGISSAGSGYRFDTVWVDATGTVQVAEGTAAPLTQIEQDNNLSRFELFSPTHPFPSSTPATVLAAVAVNDADSSVTQSQIQDRRVDAQMALSGLTLADRTATPPAPTDGRTLYIDDADGNLYKVNPDGTTSQVGGNAGALADSGTDTDGGDDYQLPNAADNIDLQGSGGVRNADVVSTEKADITGETFIKSRLTSNVNGVSSGSWTVLADTEDEDNLSEQDSSFNINVSESGWYEIEGQASFESISSGDRLDIAIRDVAADDAVGNTLARMRASGSTDSLRYATTVFLSSGTDYQVQGRDIDSTFDLVGGTAAAIPINWYRVKRSVVHP